LVLLRRARHIVSFEKAYCFRSGKPSILTRWPQLIAASLTLYLM
jgi:hypothetical protein